MKPGGFFEQFRGKAGPKSPPVAVTPPVFSALQRTRHGSCRFTLSVARGVHYEILSSTDLKLWHPLTQNTATAPVVEFVDEETAKLGCRFYRAQSQGIASTNVIGYVALTVPPGFSMIANPFQAPDNTVATLFKDWPEGTSLNKFDNTLFKLTDNICQTGVWTQPQDTLVPGDGAMFFNPTSEYLPLVFAGDVLSGTLSTPIPVGFSVRSSLLPQYGLLHEELKFPIAEGDVIHLFDRDQKKYLLFPYENGGWKRGAPTVSMGESFWVAKNTAANWTQTIVIGA